MFVAPPSAFRFTIVPAPVVTNTFSQTAVRFAAPPEDVVLSPDGVGRQVSLQAQIQKVLADFATIGEEKRQAQFTLCRRPGPRPVRLWCQG